MAEYLDKTGLTYLWSKIKAKFDAKADKTALDEKADKTALDAKADKTALDEKADKTTVNALGKRIDNLIMPSGKESSAEVIDARNGYDGTTYDTLGTAIRTQVNDLNEHLVTYSVKLDRFKQLKLFAIKNGENFVVRSEDGTNMTPAYLKFYNSNGQQLAEYSLLDYKTPKRNITYTNDDSYYITIAGGTAQNIIVEKVDDNLHYYFSNTAEKYIYDNALKVHLGELDLKKDFNARIGDIIVCENTNGDEFTVQFLSMFDEHGQQCANYSLRDYHTPKRFFVFNSSNGNDCTKIKLSGGSAQDVIIYNLSLTANEYYYENISQLTSDVDVVYGNTENSIAIRNLYELYSFNVSKGDTISFSSVDGSNMTPEYIRLYSAYGKEISYRSLKDFHTNLRTVTYEEDEQIKYIALTGGTAQDIIVKNISKSIRDVINDQTSVINRNNLMLKSLDVTEKVKEYQSKISNGLSNESFIFFTDAHTMQHNYTNSVNKSSYQIVNNYLIDKIKTYKDNTCVDFVIDGGDWLQDSDTAEDAKMHLGIVNGKCKTLGKCYHLVGNHDTNYQGSTTLDNETITNIMFRDFGKTYYSFNGKNTKFYCLNSGLDNKNTLNDFDNAQIEWLCSSLGEDSSENIAICTHIWWNGNEDAKTVFSNAITNIVNAYNNRGTYGTHNFENARGKIKFVLSGHTHKDLTETLATGTVVVSSINSGYGNNSFDMVYADYSNSKLYFVRVGVGENREFDLIS